MKKTLFLLLIVVFAHNKVKAQNNNLLFFWDFDDTTVISKKSKPGGELLVGGLTKFVPGVKGKAIKFDGFSSFVDAVPPVLNSEDFDFPKSISLEAWVSLGAYPWNWAPILTIGNYKITGFYLGIDSRGRVGIHMSDATSVWHECNSKLNPATKLGLELKKWYNIVGTYNPKEGLAIYVDGELQNTYKNFTFDYGIAYSETGKGFRMGMNREMLAPTDAVRDWATYPSQYSLDGIIDEVKIYNKALSADEIKANYVAVKPENEPQFDPRKFPTVKPSGRFAASYTRLNYYPEWDAIWPVGDFDDVVVQFDELPTKIMFWRGTRYSPCLVTENGKWMADQSRETTGNWYLSKGSSNDFPTGCIEHMSDVQCRSSRVAIIESNDARIIVNWRYLQMDVKYRQRNLPNNTGFGEWGNEVYYIYPDGVTVRKVMPGMGGWQETIFLSEPGTRPEDNVELAATTLLNMKGNSKTYSWEKGYPVYDLPNANIQLVNLKSKFKPFLIFRQGGSWDVFDGEARPEYSHFPWWNHWPVSQIVSDGRSANAPDQAAHSSLSWGDPVEDVALYGMTNEDPQTIVSLARSWNYPPELKILGTDFESNGYDYSQRAYIMTAKTNPANLKFTLGGSKGSPLVNPAFVIKNWKNSNVKLAIDGKVINRGKDFRYAIEYNAEGTPTLVVWIKYQSEKKTEMELLTE